MKNGSIVLAMFVALFISCKEEVTSDVLEKTIGKVTISEKCYSGSINKDTIWMSLTILGIHVAKGKLSYNFYEKDRNEGTFLGQLKGDTLIADYTFMSEGIVSVRQIAFLKRGETFIEGFGDVIDDNNGKVQFKDVSQLKFEGKPVLSKADCKR